jgi:hypothetical protein
MSLPDLSKFALRFQRELKAAFLLWLALTLFARGSTAAALE